MHRVLPDQRADGVPISSAEGVVGLGRAEGRLEGEDAMKKLALLALALLASCSSAPEAPNCTVEAITFRPGWCIYKITDNSTGKVIYISPSSRYLIQPAAPAP